MTMRALYSMHLVPLAFLLWSSVYTCIDASEGDGRIWKPTPEKPLPVSFVMEFRFSGNLGLNNVMWMVVAAAAGGCSMNEEHQNRRMDSDKTAPLAFGVVILPPIRRENGKTQNVAMHQYSEVFDLEHQQHFYMKHRNCYITDKVNFERLRKEGSLQVLADAVTLARRKRPPFTDADKHHLYQGLELAPQLLEQVYEPCVAKMRRIFQHGESFYTAVHMRVEDDWALYCKLLEKRAQRETGVRQRRCFGADEIANITLETEEIRGHHNFLLLYGADKFDPMDVHRTTDSMKTDPTMVWPPDVRTANPTHMGCFDKKPGREPLSYTQRTAVSMFLAADADAYIGTMHSSFFQGVSSIRGLSRPFTGNAYTYDGDVPEYKHAHRYHPKVPYSRWPEDEAEGSDG